MAYICGCTKECDSYESWITHVRDGMPVKRRPYKARTAHLESDRADLVNYIERHKLVNAPKNIDQQERTISA